MTEDQVKLLNKALALYRFTIEQRRDVNDSYESNEFSNMVLALERMIGISLDY